MTEKLYVRRHEAMTMLGVGKRVFHRLTSGPRPVLRPLRPAANMRAMFAVEDLKRIFATRENEKP
jgi:hypothetical protein